MVTKEDSLKFDRFCHVSKTQGRGKNIKPLTVRRNGQTKTWKTRPNEFSIPVKYGLYEFGYITHLNCHEWEIAK